MCAHGICINMDGSFKCQCQEGYVLSPSGHSCIGTLQLSCQRPSRRRWPPCRCFRQVDKFFCVSLDRKTWTNVRRIRASASTVAAKTSPARINASVTTDSPNRPSDHSASTWMSADSAECAPTANASTWRAPSNASAIPATSCQLTAKLAQVNIVIDSIRRIMQTNARCRY